MLRMKSAGIIAQGGVIVAGGVGVERLISDGGVALPVVLE